MSNEQIKREIAKAEFENGKRDKEEGKYNSPEKWYDNILTHNEERNERTKAYNAGHQSGRTK